MADLLFLYTSIATLFAIYAILALSFNLEYGYAGQPNLGKVFFLSIGAYVAGALVAHGIAALTGYREDLFTAQAANARLVYAAANPGAMAASSSRPSSSPRSSGPPLASSRRTPPSDSAGTSSRSCSSPSAR